MEIEKKFLIKNLPKDLETYPKELLRQGYLWKSSAIEIRIRMQGDRYYKTIKLGTGLVRYEKNIEISEKIFRKYWKLIDEERIIEKFRYKIPYKDHSVEVDIYMGKLYGLQIAEVEFKNKKNAENFKKLCWFEEEVTQNSNYKNSSLAYINFKKDNYGLH